MKQLKLLFLSLILLFNLSNAKVIGPNNFYKTIKQNRYVLVKFWAPWCAPCSILNPEFKKAKKIAGKKVLFATYNIDLKGEPLNRYNISIIPTMVLFVNGKEVSRSSSILSAEDIASWVLGYVPQ
jgi:thioredoxin